MLLRFRVANYRSLRTESELSFVATDSDDQLFRATGVRAEGRDVAVVPTVGVFGANGSGKSNLLAAMWAMREAIGKSVAEWALAQGVPRDPFALDPACREQTTLFEADILLGQPRVRYTYGFELSDDRVEAEWLHAYPHGRRQVWFDREADRADGGEEFRFPGEGLRGGREEMVRLTRSNALFLTVAASYNHRQLRPVHRWFMDSLWLVTSGGDAASRSAHTRDMLLNSGLGLRFRERIASLLRVADLGIVDMEFNPQRPDGQEVRLLHRGVAGKSVPLDFAAQESLGTHAWFALLGPMLRVLDQGLVLLADELDSSLHPTLAAEVLRLFADPVANPHDAQLVFTAHDATLLGNGPVSRPLSRDQVWITAKRKTGETELYPLVDAHPRKDENLERGYLRGRYGGVPRVSAGDLAREVGQVRAEDR